MRPRGHAWTAAARRLIPVIAAAAVEAVALASVASAHVGVPRGVAEAGPYASLRVRARGRSDHAPPRRVALFAAPTLIGLSVSSSSRSSATSRSQGG